jgi:3-deoxy-D-manno-octulosonate 8-phosphate phosphatase KdsC-like HAD superfamily phosphatase
LAVAVATPTTKLAAHFTTKLGGGRGAVREVCEMILKKAERATQ